MSRHERRRKTITEMVMEFAVEMVDGEPAVFIRADGVKIAMRGHPDTPHAMTWIPLEPGWSVCDVDYPHGLEISYNGVRVH
jgi:hypothetical protein